MFLYCTSKESDVRGTSSVNSGYNGVEFLSLPLLAIIHRGLNSLTERLCMIDVDGLKSVTFKETDCSIPLLTVSVIGCYAYKFINYQQPMTYYMRQKFIVLTQK